jgi:hypothetical protein
MSTIYIPAIAKDDYDSFRRIIQDHLPDTYDNWVRLASRLHADVVARGRAAVSVELKADEFSHYLDTTKNSPNAAGLSKFAREKALEHVK